MKGFLFSPSPTLYRSDAIAFITIKLIEVYNLNPPGSDGIADI
jgi:hypothetical protein